MIRTQKPKKAIALPERRMDELEKEYEAENADPENEKKLEELHFQLSGLIGKNNFNILREYTDRLIAQYNTEVGWFYKKGFEDGNKFSLISNDANNIDLRNR